MRKYPEFEFNCSQSTLFQAKIQAFAYLTLNMFEVVLSEAPERGGNGDRNEANVWIDFFHYALSNSAALRSILNLPHTGLLYSPVLMELFVEWWTREIELRKTEPEPQP